MGNSIITGSGRKRVKVMKMNGDTMKLRVPLRARDVTKDHPGHVLLDSDAVKHFGIRAKPLEPQQDLNPKRVYFLVETPEFDPDPRISSSSRRVRSGVISMSAKDRLECLMLSRRSASDLTTLARPSTSGPGSVGPGPVRVRVRLPRAQVEKLVRESRDEIEVAEKIIGIYMRSGNDCAADVADKGERGGGLLRREEWKSGGSSSSVVEDHKPRQKRVSFLPIEQGEIRLAEETLT